MTVLTASQEVTALLKARNACLWVVSREEFRVERAIAQAAAAAKFETFFWDCAEGLTNLAGQVVDGSLNDPVAVLRYIANSPARMIVVLRDFSAWLDPATKRLLKSTARKLQCLPAASAKALVILTDSSEIPPDLAGTITVIDWPLPSREEMSKIIDDVVGALQGDLAKSALQNGFRERAIDAAMGLTGDDAGSCYAKSLVVCKEIDPRVVSQEKKKVVAREGLIEWIDPDPRGLDAIGGLDEVKSWTMRRKLALSRAAREYGLPAPKGVLLIGVPGCGKSLMAKCVATAWGVPLLRLDLGALKSKWIGESEANIRRALSLAETIAPCVLWLDELEKSLAGATQGAADGGVSTDALGAVLSWMQDRTTPVFVVATANDVSKLPPELLRKGRFDEMFFVDLPNQTERLAIVRATLAKMGRDSKMIDERLIALNCESFTGAEIASVISDAMFDAFADGGREITTLDVARHIESTVPMSRTSAERITGLRDWARGRCRMANSASETVAMGSRQIDLS